MSCRVVIFDLDGTILNTLDDLTAAVNHALAGLGRAPLDTGTVRKFVGNGVPKLIERALNYSAGRDPDGERDSAYDECYKAFTKYYNAHSADMTRLYDGVSEMLAAVAGMGYKTAVVTNKYDAAAQALKAKFFPSVDILVGASESVRPKPAPDGVNAALKALGMSAPDGIYVGDGETDMATARACGMPAVAVTWGFRDRELLESLSPDYIIDEPQELLDILREVK